MLLSMLITALILIALTCLFYYDAKEERDASLEIGAWVIFGFICCVVAIWTTIVK